MSYMPPCGHFDCRESTVCVKPQGLKWNVLGASHSDAYSMGRREMAEKALKEVIDCSDHLDDAVSALRRLVRKEGGDDSYGQDDI